MATSRSFSWKKIPKVLAIVAIVLTVCILGWRVIKRTVSNPWGTVTKLQPEVQKNRHFNVKAPAYVEVASASVPWFNTSSDTSDPKDSKSLLGNSLAMPLPQLTQYVMALAHGLDGVLWIASEDDGVWRYDPATNTARQFTSRDGLSDDHVYALAVDKLGRVWAGNLNHGVSVFNGNAEGHWQSYDVIGGLSRPDSFNGPIGERTFAIKVCPTDGDVWIASNCGLSRYSESKRTWTYYSQATGLPSDALSSITFDQAGNIYVGTQCDGVAMAKANDHYSTWNVVTAPPGPYIDPTGEGLPSSQINDILAMDHGIVYAATKNGLAWSLNDGQTWRYVRGADWAVKVRNSANGPPEGWTERDGAILAEDYVTALSKDSTGALYVGFRQYGYESFNPQPDGSLARCPGNSERFHVTCFPTTLNASGTFAGSYGQGIKTVSVTTSDWEPGQLATLPLSASIPFPAAAAPPALADLNEYLKSVAAVPPQENSSNPMVLPLPDDWKTQGEWLGRVGRFWALLAAMDDPYKGYIWGAGPTTIPYSVAIGIKVRPREFKRYSDEWFNGDPSVLEMPPVFLDRLIRQHVVTSDQNRELAEWNDAGQNYPLTTEGPDLVTKITVPNGLFYLSVYDVDASQHNSQGDSYRDYELSIDQVSTSDASLSHLASQRLFQFHQGVYKRFLVQGPSNLAIRLLRQGSGNVTFNAAMLDLLDERTVGYSQTADEWRAKQDKAAVEHAARLAAWKTGATHEFYHYTPHNNAEKAAEVLLAQMDEMKEWNPKWFGLRQKELAVQLARWYTAKSSNQSSAALTSSLGTAMFLANQYAAWENSCEAAGRVTTRHIEKQLRWNDIKGDSNGQGYETIRGYLTVPKP